MGMVLVIKQVSDSEIIAMAANVEAIRAVLYDNERKNIDLDKSWWAIHFLLTGDPTGGEKPYCYLMEGGPSLYTEERNCFDWFDELGTMPRVLGSGDVTEFSRALELITESDFRNRFNADDLAKHEVYPNIWDRNDPQDLEYLVCHFNSLKAILKEFTENGSGAFLFIC